MINKETREKIFNFASQHEVDVSILDYPAFDNSIVGITEEGRLVYDLDKMVKEYSKDNKCSEEEALEFIDYNTRRAIPYMGENAPIIITKLEG